MTSVVLFDLGGVVFRWDPRVRLARMAPASPLETFEVDAALWGSGFAVDCDRGLYNADAQFRGTQSRARMARDYAEVRDLWASAFTPDDEVLAVVDRLRDDLVRASLTNNSELIRFGLEHRWPDVIHRFEPSLWSYEAHALKPDRALFEWAARRLGREAGDLLLVDDGAQNVEGACAAGWDALLFTSADALAADMAERGLLRE